MIFDSTLLLSSAQTLVLAAGTYSSTNIIDLGATGTPYGSLNSGAALPALVRDIGPGKEIPIRCQLTAPVNNLTSLILTLEVATVGSSDAAFTASTPVEIFRSPAYAPAQLVTGLILLPEEIPIRTNLRYLRARYIIAGTTPTTGAITTGIVAGAQTNA